MLPVLDELNGLMFHPVQHEGEENSRNVFYSGAAPNRQAIPAFDYLVIGRFSQPTGPSMTTCKPLIAVKA